jgi:peptide/nickel transport system substrate-binding protein
VKHLNHLVRLLSFCCLAFVSGFTPAQTNPETLVILTFRETTGRVFGTMDPADVLDTDNGGVVNNIYETLYTYQGESITEFEPLLATDYRVSEDGKTYTYTLREGVKFHSGNSFSCKDVEWSVQRLLVNYRGLSYFLGASFLGKDYGNADGFVTNQAEAAGVDTSIEDWDPRSWEGAEAAYADYWQRVDNAVVCPDDYTVQFNLFRRDPSFFVKMITIPASIIDSDWAKANGEWDGTEATYLEWVGKDTSSGYLFEHMSGTGAYRLINTDGQSVFAEAFSDYWGGEPAINTIQFQATTDVDATLLSLQNGNADIIDTSGVNDEPGVLDSKLRGSPGVVIREDPSWASADTFVLAFNQNINMDGNEFVGSGQLDGNGIPADFFSDINVRRGFAYSYDPEEEIAFNSGRALQRTMAIAPFIPGYDPEIPVYSYDPEKAEEAFRAAHGGELWELGFAMTFVVRAPTISFDILKANLEDLNPKFKIDIVTLGEDEFFTLWENGAFPLTPVEFAMDYPRADNLLYDIYYTGDSGNHWGFSNYVDEELNTLLDAAISTNDEAEAASLYAQVGRHIYETTASIILPSSNAIFLVSRDNVQGLYFNPVLFSIYLWKFLSKS